MFGIVTKRQLDRHAEELRAEVEAARRDIDALKFEWNSMYDKFRTMLARWVKRDRVAADATSPEPDSGADGAGSATAAGRTGRIESFPHSRRGF